MTAQLGRAGSAHVIAISSVHRAEPLKPCRVHLEWNEGGASRRISRRKDRVTAREFTDMASFVGHALSLLAAPLVVYYPFARLISL